MPFLLCSSGIAIEQLLGSLSMAVCLQLVYLGQAAHVLVGEVNVAAEDDLVGVHVVGAIVEAQAGVCIDALVANGGGLGEVDEIGGHGGIHVDAIGGEERGRVGEGDGLVEGEGEGEAGEGQVHVVVGRRGRRGRWVLRRGSAVHVEVEGRGGEVVEAVMMGVGMVVGEVAGRSYEHAVAAIVTQCQVAGAKICAKAVSVCVRAAQGWLAGGMPAAGMGQWARTLWRVVSILGVQQNGGAIGRKRRGLWILRRGVLAAMAHSSSGHGVGQRRGWWR